MSEIILEMKGITKTFPGVKALSSVNLQVKAGEIHALCGENGAGKSTLMKVLSGVYPHGTYEGDIYYQGQVCQFKDIKDSEGLGIVIIHQELALIPYLSISENIFLGNEQARRGVINWNETTVKTKALLTTVGLKESPFTGVSTIGVGKQQLVEIAKALSKEVKLLILDEPTAALNEDDSENLLLLILEPEEAGDILDYHFPQIERNRENSGFRHDSAGWTDHQDPGYEAGCRYRGCHYQRHGRARSDEPLP